MTATTVAPATGTQLIPTLGFELSFTGIGRSGENSHKFWRVLCAGSTVIRHHGRIGTAGQVHVTRHATVSEARALAQDLAEKKGRQTGYEFSRNFVQFDLDAETVARAGSTQTAKNAPGTSEAVSREAIATFLASSTRTGR